MMRVAITVRADARSWAETVTYVQEAERLGVAVCFVPEAWGTDAVTPLAYLAARTERIVLGSGIMQISSRTPAMTAQTALTLAAVSGNRFILGLGVSGPQVVEGLHGQPFAHPLGRMRETIAIIRQAFAGERISFQGHHFQLPRAGGEGKALRIDQPPNPHIPIYLATLAPKMLALTGELADGWLGTSFIPEGAAAYLDHLAAGAAHAGRSLADLDLSQGGDVAFSDDVAPLLAARKSRLAFSLGGMGSATTNFYNDAYSRQGWADVAAEARRLWIAGKRQDAVAVIPDDMVLKTTMIGTESMVRDRMRAWRDAGITTLRVYPAGETLDERLVTLARALALVEDLNRESNPPFPRSSP
jgi:F420-dependent oxidoreductase-like protein